MKSSPLFVLSLSTALLFSVAACNSSETKTESAVSSDSATNTSNTTQPAADKTNTIITTPQNMVVIKHRVKDFAAWKMNYDAHDSARLANGLHNYVVSRGVDDSNMVMVSLKTDDMVKAKAFATSAGLKQAMQKGGVTGTPSINYFTATFQDTVTINTTLRSATMFQVKDWTAWEKSFKEGEQERIDNGITVRVYGHDADNNNKVRLITAIMDTAKAHAYWKSDLLKKRRAESGVITEPERFVYNIVQRY